MLAQSSQAARGVEPARCEYARAREGSELGAPGAPDSWAPASQRLLGRVRRHARGVAALLLAAAALCALAAARPGTSRRGVISAFGHVEFVESKQARDELRRERAKLKAKLAALRDEEANIDLRLSTIKKKLEKGRHEHFPSFFCFLVMQTVQDSPEMGWAEEALVRDSFVKQAGIFACEGSAVFTIRRVVIGPALGKHGFRAVDDDYVPKDNETTSWGVGGHTAQKGSQSNPLNSQMFINSWKAIEKHSMLDGHHWVAKVDPDAVFFPHRIRWHLGVLFPQDLRGEGKYFLLNCQRFYSMQGPVELLSKAAAATFMQSMKQVCPVGQAVAEDQYMQKCLQSLGVKGVFNDHILQDQYCEQTLPDCDSGAVVAFHPFKDPKLYEKCRNASVTRELNDQKVALQAGHCTDAGTHCKFPFNYNGGQFTACTQVDSDRDDRNGNGNHNDGKPWCGTQTWVSNDPQSYGSCTPCGA